MNEISSNLNLVKRNMILNHLAQSHEAETFDMLIEEVPKLKVEFTFIIYKLYCLVCEDKITEAFEYFSRLSIDSMDDIKLYLQVNVSRITGWIKLLLIETLIQKPEENSLNKAIQLLNTVNEEEAAFISKEYFGSVLLSKLNKKFSKENFKMLLLDNVYSLDKCFDCLEYNQLHNINSMENQSLKQLSKLEVHTEEVMNLAFSPDSTGLASVTKGKSLNIYSLKYTDKQANLVLTHKLDFSSEITSVAWSEDGKKLAVTFKDKSLKIMQVSNGKIIQSLKGHTESVSSVVWIKNDKIISSGLDKKVIIWVKSVFSEEFKEKRIFEIEIISEMLYSKIHNIVVLSAPSINSIIFYCAKDYVMIFKLQIDDVVVSMNLSRLDDGEYLLINSSKKTPVITSYRIVCTTRSEESNLFDCAVQRKYFGHKQETFSIRCAYGGPQESFIISGSESAVLHIWSRNRSIPIYTLKSHSAPLNCAVWFHSESAKTDLIITCSDDHLIKIFTLKKKNEINENTTFNFTDRTN